MRKLQKAIAVIILLIVFLQVQSNADLYNWSGSGHYQIGGEFGYPNPDGVNTYDTVTVTIVHGGGVGNNFNMYDSSALSMFDDSYIGNLNLYENATASLYGTAPLMHLWVDAASTGWVKLYAHDVMYEPSSGPTDGGGVLGYWISNNQWFDISFKGDRTQGEITKSFIQIIPEPVTLILLALGSIAVLRRRR
jgi:hypothetical protein